MLKRVEVKSFKSLEDVSVDLGLVNVFIGANGSGKSNLLEAIGVLGAAAAGRVDDEGLLRRGVRPGVPALYKSSFRHDRIRDAIRFGGFNDQASYEVELNNPNENPKPSWDFKTEKLIADGVKIVGRSPASNDFRSLNSEAGLAALKTVELPPESASNRLLTLLREYAIYAPNTATLRGLVPDPQTREPAGLSGGRLADAVDELNKLAPGNEFYEGVQDDLLELIDWVGAFGSKEAHKVPLSPSIPRQRQTLFFRDRYMAEKRNELSAYDASEGALYVLFAAVAATHPNAPKLLAIDNVDSGLNPRLVRSLMERLCNWVLEQSVRQLLFTCHNPSVLDGLPLQDDRVRLFAVDRTSNGKTVIHRVVVDDNLLAKAKEGWPLSRLWVAGHIGGVPNV